MRIRPSRHHPFPRQRRSADVGAPVGAPPGWTSPRRGTRGAIASFSVSPIAVTPRTRPRVHQAILLHRPCRRGTPPRPPPSLALRFPGSARPSVVPGYPPEDITTQTVGLGSISIFASRDLPPRATAGAGGRDRFSGEGKRLRLGSPKRTLNSRPGGRPVDQSPAYRMPAEDDPLGTKGPPAAARRSPVHPRLDFRG